jgi:hypothetical protein
MNDYPIPEFTLVDVVGIYHAAYFAGPSQERYVRTRCDWWQIAELPRDPRRHTVQLHPRDRFHVTCLVCCRREVP